MNRSVNKTKIYEITSNQGGSQIWYCATMKEAEAIKRDMRKKEGRRDVRIRPFPVAQTRVGIASAMNFVLRTTCYNEN